MGNVAVGFDVLGHAVVALHDRVTVSISETPGVTIREITALGLPVSPRENTATAGLERLLEDRSLPFGFEVSVEKGIPLGSGMGGSAASAAAAVVAASAVLETPLDDREFLRYGMFGERAATGTFHADNLAPSLLGGLVLTTPADPPEVIRIPTPASLRCVLVHPSLRLDTRDARAVLPDRVSLSDHSRQSARLAIVIAGCYSGDLSLIGRALEDLLVEPHRARLVPGFTEVKRAALEAGALGCSLSGAGPSVFAWCDGDAAAAEAARRMTDAFERVGIRARSWTSPVDAPGARVVARYTNGVQEAT